jgi:hypothetical protein
MEWTDYLAVPLTILEVSRPAQYPTLNLELEVLESW